MELKEIESAIEGVLFAAGEPVGVERLCLGLEVDRATMDAVAQRLMDRYSYERRGIRLGAAGYQLPAVLCSGIRSLYPQDFGESEAGRGCPSLRWRCWR